MVDQGSGSVRSFNVINAKFINDGRAEDEDEATFEFGGFVVKSIYERNDKEGNLIGYRLEVGQANYNDTNANIIKFDIDKTDTGIAQAIEANYLPGSTVSFSGEISYKVRTETVQEQVAFGDPVTKTRVFSDKVYRIKGGNEPLDEDNPNFYTPEECRTLVDAWKKDNEDKVAKAAEANAPAEAAQAAPANSGAAKLNSMTRMQSLI